MFNLNELNEWDLFRNMQSQHMGVEKVKRKFLDNASGVCSRCGEFPSSQDQEFLSLKLIVPYSELPIDLVSLIFNYFSEDPEVVKIKCTNCCVHENPPDGLKVPCPQEGFCSRPSVSCCELIHAPQFLFLHLLRFGLGHNGPKVQTLVKFASEVMISNGEKYEVVATINHWGNALKSGHFVTYLKNESGQWWLLDDTNSKCSSLQEANTKDNYVVLLKKKSVQIDLICFNHVNKGQ